MKIVAVGIGQCGCNIVDEFYAINNYARSFFNRRLEILTDAFAVNTDEADLMGLSHISRDKRHRIVIGTMKTLGHGVGKINFDAARIMKESHSIISDNILTSKKFHESDAIIVIASGGGGTGSGSIGWLVKGLKERVEKPIYAMVVLPFGYEEKGDTSYAVTNTATCLNMVNQYADAVFLLDNERFGKTDASLARNFKDINRAMVKNFYDLFCAGEERKQKYIGSKVVDAGDILQTLEAITTIGRGEISLSTFYRWKKEDFREGVKERGSTAGALHQAVNNLSLSVGMEVARKILALVSAPKDVITLTSLEEISTFLQEKSPKSIVRIGDYPRRGKEISVTLILSKLTQVTRVENLYHQAEVSFKKQEEIDKEAEQKIKQIYEAGKHLPTLD
jgi:cell division GTPase FtsZ